MHRLAVILKTAAKEIIRSAPALFSAAALACPALAGGAVTNIYSLGQSVSPTNNPLSIEQAEAVAAQMRQLQSSLASAVASGDPRAKAAADTLRRSATVR